MNDKLFIADKIKVGFNLRSDTYTGLLGYVIGYDGKKWRKEPSWESWRCKFNGDPEFEIAKREQFNRRLENLKANYERYKDDYYEKQLETFEKSYDTFQPSTKFSNDERVKPLEFENVPTEGFVLNKKVGGTNYSWNNRATYSRVYDPRGFEFEITVQNLLYILQECNSYKGKGLEGHFVYAWDGKDLVLLPTTSVEYRESQKFTKLQSCKLSTRDLAVGCAYKSKKMEEYIYLGKFNWAEKGWNNNIQVDNRYVFIHAKTNTFLGTTSLTSFAERLTDVSVDNYAELLDKFNKDEHCRPLIDINVERYYPQITLNYYEKPEAQIAYLPIDKATYEVYSVVGSDINRKYSSSAYKINSYNLTMNRIVKIKDDGCFEIKKVTPKKLEGVYLSTVESMNLKTLKINKDRLIF